MIETMRDIMYDYLPKASPPKPMKRNKNMNEMHIQRIAQ